MGERATDLVGGNVRSTDGAGGEGQSPRETVRQLESDIRALRQELGQLVTELNRRRHAALDVRLQMRRHAREVALTGVALVGAAAGLVWFNVWRARRGQRLGTRVGRLHDAVGRMIARPERVAAAPTVAGRILTAAASAAVATVIKKVLGRVVQGVMDRQQPTASETWGPAQPPARPKSPPAA